MSAQGAVGDSFFCVQEGHFRYTLDGTEVGEYVHGDCFGELGLLHNTARDVSVMAVEDPCVVWTIGRADFRKTLANFQRKRKEKVVKRLMKVKSREGTGKGQ